MLYADYYETVGAVCDDLLLTTVFALSDNISGFQEPGTADFYGIFDLLLSSGVYDDEMFGLIEGALISGDFLSF